MAEVVVTGLGFISSIGNDAPSVEQNLRRLQHGIERYEPFQKDNIPVKVLGTVKDFDVRSKDPEDWTHPGTYKITREMLRSMSPHSLYGYYAVNQAIADAGLSDDLVSNPRTGIYTASPGSPGTLYHHLGRMFQFGVARSSPMGVVASVVGTLTFNLVAQFSIQGASCGFASACASSAHALGYAWDEIATGRQDRMIVVGAEDGDLENVLPFAAMRALTTSDDPDTASKPFDKKRSGFVGAGGSCAIVLESSESAKKRGAPVYARMLGWGQSSDGHNVAISHPEGAGLIRAMEQALTSTSLTPDKVDYVNAHAASTQIGDLSEARALKNVFTQSSPMISSTKALTGHGLSMTSILEAAFCCLSMKQEFVPGSAHISELDPACEGLDIIRETKEVRPAITMSNSSGFGGANVSLIFQSS